MRRIYFEWRLERKSLVLSSESALDGVWCCRWPSTSTQHVITWPDPSPSLCFVLRMAPGCFPLRRTLWVLDSSVYFARSASVHLFLQTLQCNRMNVMNIGEFYVGWGLVQSFNRVLRMWQVSRGQLQSTRVRQSSGWNTLVRLRS